MVGLRRLALISVFAAAISSLSSCGGGDLSEQEGCNQVYASLCNLSGIEFPDLCDRLVRLGVERHAREARYRF